MTHRFVWPALALGALLGAPLGLARLRERLAPRELTGEGHFAQVCGYTLHYTDEGPRDGPPVLLLHGFAAWAFTWRHLRPALARAGFRTLSLDLLGSGASERPARPVYTTQTQAELTLGLLDTLGLAQAHLVGHSFGGRVALQIALEAPRRVRSLALLSPEAFATQRPPVARWLRVPLLGYALAFYSTAPALVPTGLRMVTRQHAWLTAAALAGYAAPLRVRGSAAAQVWHARSPKDGPRALPPRLGQIQAPTLIVWGEADPVFPADHGRKLADSLPNARLYRIPGAGHLPHEEAPAATIGAVLEFIKEHA